MSCPTVPRPGKVCANPACGQWFRPRANNYARQKYCCHPCAVQARPRLSRVLAGRKAGETKRRLRPARIQHIRQQEYRRGYSDGYERALRDMEGR